MFTDRADAGRQLGRRLAGKALHDPIVLAIPRGGVVTGAALAREIGADLDVVLARKLRAPDQPELALGAIGEDGRAHVNRAIAADIGVTARYLAAEQDKQLQVILAQRRCFRGGRPAAAVNGRSVILTDDGIATGATLVAALHVVKALEPREIIIAAPVAPAERLEAMRPLCDHMICLEAPEDFHAVGQFYRSFEPVQDGEVVRLLGEFAPLAPRPE